tara:strand:+ start:161 stop:307 length:147 start_codon:yes stop_codon:yes gene_type:complete
MKTCKFCTAKITGQSKLGKCRKCAMKHTVLLRRFNELKKDIMEVVNKK